MFLRPVLRNVLPACVFSGAGSLSHQGWSSVCSSDDWLCREMLRYVYCRMLTFTLSASFSSAASGFAVGPLGDYRIVMWISFVSSRSPLARHLIRRNFFYTAGDGFGIRLDDHARRYFVAVRRHRVLSMDAYHIEPSSARQEIFPLLAGLGLGGLWQVPIIGMQAAMPLRDMATSTSALLFVR